MAAKPVIAIVGQTASGKSSLALDIAERYDGEIIAADSRTVYKNLDIGTAKPSKEDQEKAPHYGLDLVEPTKKYSVFEYQKYAQDKLKVIKKNNKLPIIVGGTGLYVDAVLYDFQFKDIDKQRIKELRSKNLQELVKLAKKIDKNISNSMLNNKRHLVSFIERGGHANRNYYSRDDLVIVGIFPSKRSLRDNINKRVEIMFKQGLRKEVKELVNKYGWDNEAMSGIGYREFKDYYEGKISMSKVKRDIVQNTLKYAKRQKTWFKRNPNIENFETIEEAKKFINIKLKQDFNL